MVLEYMVTVWDTAEPKTYCHDNVKVIKVRLIQPAYLACPYLFRSLESRQNFVCCINLLVYLKCHCSKHCGPRSDCCSYRSSLIRVHTPKSVPDVSIFMQQITSADAFFKCNFCVADKGLNFRTTVLEPTDVNEELWY